MKQGCEEKSYCLPCSKTKMPSGLRSDCEPGSPLRSMRSGICGSSFRAYGGSAKMMSYCWREDFRKRNTSPLISEHSLTPIFSRHWRMNAAWSRSASTLTTLEHPLESISSVMLPVPAKRSRAVAPSISTYPLRTLKMFSLAKSVVGRALNVRGTSKRRPLYFPVMIRIGR